MSETPKSHRERAEIAVARLGRTFSTDDLSEVVAEGTYPTELVKAGAKAVQWMRKAIRANVGLEDFDPDNHVALRPLLDALALYEPEEAKNV